MKRKAVKGLAFLTAAAMTATALPGTGIPVQAADETWISDENLSEEDVAEPAKDTVLPDANQYRYQKEELAAFCHFGPNTFNNTEWGDYGSKKAADVFTLSKDFDAVKLVETLKEAGFEKLIVTAKHHDGFCIWDSKYTEFDVAATNYKNGEGDILAEISEACSDADMDMGLYLSPWDVNAPSYGYYDEKGNPILNKDGSLPQGMTWEDVEAADADDYNEYYNNQLIEILSSEKYGNKGKFVEVWMDGAKGSNQAVQNYDFVKWFDTIQKYEGKAADRDADCMLFGAEAYTTVRWIGNENGTADKNTWSKSKVDKAANTINSNKKGSHTVGFEDGNQWTVPEADARITSGWFWGPNKATPKSIEDLASMYFNSVGHNAVLLLNVPPNNQGTVDEAILERVKEFGENIKETFKTNMAATEGAQVLASEVRGNSTKFGPGTTVDNNDNTYWTTEDRTNEGSLLINLGGSQRFDVVSIEEAIQNGQRINKYKVEYRSGSSAWTVLDEGETIGAKRLIRTGEIRADQIRITVSAPKGKVPMISEVGVYKASKSFELPSSAPIGMDVVDIEDVDTTDGAGFNFGQSKWTAETGSNFVNGTNRWTNAGGSLTFTFHGSKFYIVGTKDPKHGNAVIKIDEEPEQTVSTQADKRAVGQIWYTSPDLEDGSHTVTITAQGGAIGIEAAYVINNDGIGMIGLEQDEYTMNEDETMHVKVVRVGGSKGRVSALLTGNPGSAVQGDFDTSAKVVTLGHGETETYVPVTTMRANDGKDPVESRDFTIELDTPSTGLILGFNDAATVNILDAEFMTKQKLDELIEKADGRVEGAWTGDYAAYAEALAQAKKLSETESPDALEMILAYQALEAAADSMTERTQFTEADPVVFPVSSGEKTHVEAELLTLIDAAGAKQPLQITEDSSKSNGKHVTWFNSGDKIQIPYVADRAGSYTVTMDCFTGATESKPNTFTVSGDNIDETAVSVHGSNINGSNETVDFEIIVNQAGAGVITLTAGGANGPSIDKFVVTPKTFSGPYMIDISATPGGTVTADPEVVNAGEETVLTVTPDNGYTVSQVMVNNENVTESVEDGTYTINNVNEDTKVNVIFTFVNYTEENRFNFPTTVGEEGAVTLQAENMMLHNVGDEPKWFVQVSDAEWADGGKYVNAMNAGDTAQLYYYAAKTGTYKAALQYRSGDAKNSMTWTEADGKIQNGTLESVEAENNAATTHKVELTWEVTKPGAGVLTFTAGEKNAPQLDKFDIVLTEETGAIADKIALEIAIQDAERELSREDTYTEETRADLQAAMEEAKTVFGNEAATQAEADVQVKAIREALDGLTLQTFDIITAVEGEIGGRITASQDSVERGASVDLTITPDYGYTLTSLKVNDAEVTGFHKYNVDYSISNITENKTITAAFEKTGYTSDEPFVFPTGEETKTLEAEDFTLFNVNGNTERWKLGITNGNTAGWEGGAVYINSFEPGDYISVPYSAAAGTYEVTVTYSSGSTANKLVWDSDGTIEAGEASAGSNNANQFLTTKFEVTVNEDGAGVWTFTSPADNKSPRVDKFQIKLKGTTDPTERFDVTARVDGGNGTVSVDPAEVASGGDATVTFVPRDGYAVGTVTVNGEEAEVTGNSYTVSDITADTEIVVTYVFDHYTTDEPFYFPTAAANTETVQAENFILQDNNDGAGEIRKESGGWAEGGSFVNWFNRGDSIVLNYYAQTAGEYKFTMRYQSGSASNGISWSGDKIEEGSLNGVTADSSSSLQPRTVDFTVNVTEAGAGRLMIAAGQANAPQVDQFVVELVEAKGTPAEVDKDSLAQAIEDAEAKAAQTGVYTADSIARLEAAIAAAQSVYDDSAATQKQVDEQVNILKNFVLDRISEKTTYNVNFSADVNGSIKVDGLQEGNVVEEGGGISYTVTADSGFVIDTLTVNGQAVAEAAGQTEYTGAVTDIRAEVSIQAAFKAESTEPVPELPTRADLWNAIEAARAILGQTGRYTAASLRAYGEIIDAAYVIYESESADLEDFANAIQSLQDGMSRLEEISGPGTDKPSGTDKPTGTDKLSGGSGVDKAVQTGDESSLILWAVVLAAACGAAVAVIIIRKKNSKK